MKKLAVIVPVFNEQENIRQTIDQLCSIRNDLFDKDINLKIYVINDGSTDRTAEILKNLSVDKILNHSKNLGLGAAVRSGLIAARQDRVDIVVKFDADLQHHVQDIKNLIEPIVLKNADIVYGHRFNLISYKMPLIRKIGNIFFSYLMRKLTSWPVFDSQPGILAISSEYLKKFNMPGDYNYTQQILLDAYYKNFRFAHVDVHFDQRASGESFVSLSYPFKVIPQIIQVIIGIKPLKIFVPIGLFFSGLSLIVAFIEIGQWILQDSIKPIVHVNFVLGFGLFGLQTLFFGVLADLIIRTRR